MKRVYTSSSLRHQQGNVIAMERFRSGASLSPINQVEAYWAALREGADVPRRSQIDPRGLENALSYTFVVERIAPGVARFRLAGQHLTDFTGLDVRGMPLTALFTPSGRTQVGAALEQLFNGPAVTELTLQSEAGRHNVQREARMILLPLRSEFGDISRALGALVMDGTTPEGGCRFDVTATRFRAAGPNGAAQPEPRQLTKGFAEAQTPFDGKPPDLRLIKT